MFLNHELLGLHKFIADIANIFLTTNLCTNFHEWQGATPILSPMILTIHNFAVPLPH